MQAQALIEELQGLCIYMSLLKLLLKKERHFHAHLLFQISAVLPYFSVVKTHLLVLYAQKEV